MKKLFTLLVMCLVGLGCYQLGRRPNSPDVVGWLSVRLGRVDWQSVGQKADQGLQIARQQLGTWRADWQQGAAGPVPAPAAPRPAANRLAPPAPSQQADFPQCW